MSRCIAIAAVCAALTFVSGCGSSGSSSTGSSSNGSSSNGSPSNGATTTGGTQARTNRGSLKVTTTPKFAPATGPVRSGTVRIAYRNIAIAPDTVRVKVGTVIEWTNYDEVAHNVTSEGGPQSFASKDFGKGGTFEIKALKPGVIHYECTSHPASMNGTIEVIG
jgi:plastocyanin